MHVKQDKPQNAAEVLKFFDWAFKNGQTMAAELDYVPMPENVTKVIAESWKAQVKDAVGQGRLELIAVLRHRAYTRRSTVCILRPGRVRQFPAGFICERLR